MHCQSYRRHLIHSTFNKRVLALGSLVLHLVSEIVRSKHLSLKLKLCFNIRTLHLLHILGCCINMLDYVHVWILSNLTKLQVSLLFN
jgi:hypothetical protein